MSVRTLGILLFAGLLLVPVGIHFLLVPGQEARLAERFAQRAETEHLVIWSTMAADETEQLARAGEAFFELFEERWRPLTGLRPLPGRVSVYVLEDHTRMTTFYQAERGDEAGSLEHNSGFYDGARREVALYGASAAECHATLVHELTHTLHHPWNVPAWVAEGFAQTVEYELTGKPAAAGPGCWDSLTRWSGPPAESRLFDLTPITAPDENAHLAFTSADNQYAYGRALALFSFLLNTPDEGIRARFLAALRSASGRERQLDAIALVLGLTSAELQERFTAFWIAAQNRALKLLAEDALGVGK